MRILWAILLLTAGYLALRWGLHIVAIVVAGLAAYLVLDQVDRWQKWR